MPPTIPTHLSVSPIALALLPSLAPTPCSGGEMLRGRGGLYREKMYVHWVLSRSQRPLISVFNRFRVPPRSSQSLSLSLSLSPCHLSFYTLFLPATAKFEVKRDGNGIVYGTWLDILLKHSSTVPTALLAPISLGFLWLMILTFQGVWFVKNDSRRDDVFLKGGWRGKIITCFFFVQRFS